MANMSLKKNEMPSQAPEIRQKNYLEVALGYTKNAEGKWCDKNGEITGIMAKLADKPINDMNSAINSLTLDDVFTGEKTGLLAIIPANTPINEINDAINGSIQDTPLQFFIDEGLISFDDYTESLLDHYCYIVEDGNENKTEMVDISDFADEQKKYYANCKGYHMFEYSGINMKYDWEENTIPKWRTMPLNQSLNYIVKLISSTTVK